MFIDYVYEYENPPIIAVKKHSIRWRILQEVISWAHQRSELHKIRALMHTMRLYRPAYLLCQSVNCLLYQGWENCMLSLCYVLQWNHTIEISAVGIAPLTPEPKLHRFAPVPGPQGFQFLSSVFWHWFRSQSSLLTAACVCVCVCLELTHVVWWQRL